MPHRRSKFLRILLNPLVIISVLVLAISAAWLVYIERTGNISQARPGANMLPALYPAVSGPFAWPGAPAAGVDPTGGWTAGHTGQAETGLQMVNGQLGGEQALKLDITGYGSGDVTLTSPRVEVAANTTYLFKAFATSDMDFRLLARKYHKDGSTSLEQLRNPVERPGTSAFAVSDAFASGDSVNAVEYVFRYAAKGTAQVEGAYLEPADDVKVPEPMPSGTNLIPNPGFSGGHPSAPDSWSPYMSGTSQVESGRGEDGRGSFLWTRVANYATGEAKWQYQPVPVAPDRYFTFGATYKSDSPVDVVAEFELAGGGRKFRNLETVLPAGDWTRIKETFQAPEGALNVMVTLISHANGTTAVRDFSLLDVTRPGPLRWKQPMVSITFDDGWQSVYDRALPLLEKHGFRSTQYVNAGSIETPNFITAEEVRLMHQAGHEIAAHSYDHVDLTSVSAERLDSELRRSEEALAAAELPTDDLAPPYGRSDPQVDWYASKYFDLVRGTDDGINTRQNIDPHNLKVLYVTDETTLQELQDALEETKRLNGWLIVVYHQITAPGAAGQHQGSVEADRSTISSDVLATQLQLIDDSAIEVQPVAKAFETLQGP